MKVFVTGGSGYVGQATIAALGRRGHEVTALARSASSGQIVEKLGARPVRGGLEDVDVLRDAAAQADGVIHLAWAPVDDIEQVDLGAAEALLDGAGSNPYVHAGGSWVFGNTDGVVDEDATKDPLPFLAWRLNNERVVMDRAANGNHPVLVMPGLVYGNRGGFVEQLVIAPARDHGSVRYIGDGSNHWSLVHVDDIADLFVLALGAPAGSAYFGVSENSLTVAELLPALTAAAGCPGQVQSRTLEQAREDIGPIADGLALDQRLSSERARTQLGWQPSQKRVHDGLT